MSEHDAEDRTHQASAKRQDKLRREGRFARSPDIASVAALAGAALAIGMAGQHTLQSFEQLGRYALSLRDHSDPQHGLQLWGQALLSALTPVLIAVTVAAIAAGVAQTRGLVEPSLLMPKWERLDPRQSLKQLLPGRDSLVDIGKQLAKIGIFAAVTYSVIHTELERFRELGRVDIKLGASVLIAALGRFSLHSLLAFAAIAALDYMLARRRFARETRMSDHELREEHKEDEGHPMRKQRARQRMRELSKRRALTDMRRATVLVTNPTHFAAALRYDPPADAAPVLLAKAADDAALAMRAQARQHRIPIVEHRALARALFRHGRPGRPIPTDLYRVSAEVIAHVMRLRGRRLA